MGRRVGRLELRGGVGLRERIVGSEMETREEEVWEEGVVGGGRISYACYE